jgi:hypothetical protein
MTLWNPIPTPSITARKIAHMMAPFLAAFRPPRIAKEPPVKNPAMTEMMISSLSQQAPQSIRLDMTAKGRVTHLHYMGLLSS